MPEKYSPNNKKQPVRKLISQARIYNPYYQKFIPASLLLKGSNIEFCGPEEEIPQEILAAIKAENFYKADNKRVVPGLIDIHMHIESSMMAPGPFSRQIIKEGTTTIVAEPHEIANVFGLEGILQMIRAGERTVVDIFWAIPSSVPSTDKSLETSGGEIGIAELKRLIPEEKVICLGEVMNNRAVLQEPESLIRKLIAYYQQNSINSIIEGHIPTLTGFDLAQFVARGIDSDHTLQNLTRFKQRIRNGVFVEIQEKSLSEELMSYIKTNNLFDSVALVTDDVMADSLIEEGHLNQVLRRSLQAGLSLEEALYISTYTPARRMQLTDRGSLAPGKKADFLILEPEKDFAPEAVFKSGELVFSKDEASYGFTGLRQEEQQTKDFPANFYQSINCPKISQADLEVYLPEESEDTTVVSCRAMEVKKDTTYTEEVEAIFAVEERKVLWEETGCALATVIERHGRKGNCGQGFITGDTIKEGAVATTYAHDHHNLYLVAQNYRDGVIAANQVIEQRGGLAVVNKGEVLATLALPVAGILAERPVLKVGQELRQVTESLASLGYEHYNIIMSLCTNTLPVSPELKITDKGLIDVKSQKRVNLFYD